MTQPLIIIGCGGHAKSLIDIVETTNEFEIIGLVGRGSEVGKKILGYSVIGCDGDLNRIQKRCSNALLAIGQLKDATLRKRIAAMIIELQFNTPTIISSKAHVSPHARIGEGTTIGHGAIINAGAVIGRFCIINSHALIEHDSTLR